MAVLVNHVAEDAVGGRHDHSQHLAPMGPAAACAGHDASYEDVVGLHDHHALQWELVLPVAVCVGLDASSEDAVGLRDQGLQLALRGFAGLAGLAEDVGLHVVDEMTQFFLLAGNAAREALSCDDVLARHLVVVLSAAVHANLDGG